MILAEQEMTDEQKTQKAIKKPKFYICRFLPFTLRLTFGMKWHRPEFSRWERNYSYKIDRVRMAAIIIGPLVIEWAEVWD